MTTINYGDVVFILNFAHEKYISIAKDGEIDASHNLAGDLSAIVIEGGPTGTPVMLNGRVNLRSVHNKLITVTFLGALLANRDKADNPETLVVVNAKDKNNTGPLTSDIIVSFLAHTGKTIGVEPDGKINAKKVKWENGCDHFQIMHALESNRNGRKGIGTRQPIPQDVTSGLANMTLQDPNIKSTQQQGVPPQFAQFPYGIPPHGFFPPHMMPSPQQGGQQPFPPQVVPIQLPPNMMPPPQQGLPPQGFIPYPYYPYPPQHGGQPTPFPQGPPYGFPNFMPYHQGVPQQVPSQLSPQMIPQSFPQQSFAQQPIITSQPGPKPENNEQGLSSAAKNGIRDHQSTLDKYLEQISKAVGRPVYLEIDWVALDKHDFSSLYKEANLAKSLYYYIEMLSQHLVQFLQDDMNKKAFLQNFTNNRIQFGFDENETVMPKNSYYHYTHVTKDGNIKIWCKPNTYQQNVSCPSVGEQIEDTLTLDGWSLIAARNIRDKKPETDKYLQEISRALGKQVELDLDWKWLLAYNFDGNSRIHTRVKSGDTLATNFNFYLEELSKHIVKFVEDDMNKRALLQNFTSNKIQFGVDENGTVMPKNCYYHYTHVTKDGNIKIWVKPNTYQQNIAYPSVGEQIDNDLMLDGWPVTAAINLRDQYVITNKHLQRISNALSVPVQLDIDWNWLFNYPGFQNHFTRLKKGDNLGNTINSYLKELANHIVEFVSDDMCKEALQERFTGGKIQFGVDENICKHDYHYTQITPDGNLKIYCRPDSFLINLTYPTVGQQLESQL
jgi:hypothetical protein